MVLGLATVGALAAGSHDVLNCAGCHSIHYAKGYKAFAVINDKAQNPKTKSTIDGVSALCLGCHENPENGGAGLKPVNMHTTHPVNVAPNGRIAKVPAAALVNGKLQCTSCHDPHPSNAGYRYLRVDTKDGGEMPTFCSMCHPAKVDLSILKGGVQVFSSMDETKGANVAPADQQVYTNPTEDYYSKGDQTK
jgi:predicted CXXCH cytochrome family protein